ncbi:hypothetical protein BpHYR1_039035 [Brachionus plicatilis]|uniref:Uncharacterized protein n=1 Tax=Brachionus plicatilis TaxID=10195 RepID=A0A3M7R4K7_BRAPC|nr:hypothetical protein BpHYR1_039035 [Brachionus plicatilis]
MKKKIVVNRIFFCVLFEKNCSVLKNCSQLPSPINHHIHQNNMLKNTRFNHLRLFAFESLRSFSNSYILIHDAKSFFSFC